MGFALFELVCINFLNYALILIASLAFPAR